MNPSDFLRREIIRPFVTLVVPGGIALTPYVLLLIRERRDVGTFVVSNSGTAALLVLFGAIAAGLILEDIGSWIESRLWDKKLAKKDKAHFETWREYLKLKFQVEPIGQSYIRSILLRMKFELGFGLALMVTLPGTISLGWQLGLPLWPHLTLIFVLTLAIGGYLLHESYDSAHTLSRVRKLLVAASGE